MLSIASYDIGCLDEYRIFCVNNLKPNYGNVCYLKSRGGATNVSSQVLMASLNFGFHDINFLKTVVILMCTYKIVASLKRKV